MGFPVASQPDGYQPLVEIQDSGKCIVGAHSHPWVNPPFKEPVNRFTSFAGNLPLTFIDTSFNMHEEPIVNSPWDAIPDFLQGNLDYLAIGNFLVRHPHGVGTGKNQVKRH